MVHDKRVAVAVPAIKRLVPMNKWNEAVRVATERDALRDMIADIRHVLKCHEEGDEKLTLEMIREVVEL